MALLQIFLNLNLTFESKSYFAVSVNPEVIYSTPVLPAGQAFLPDTS